MPITDHPFPIDKNIVRKVIGKNYFIKAELFKYHEDGKNIFVIGPKCNVTEQELYNRLVLPIQIEEFQVRMPLTDLSNNNAFIFKFNEQMYVNIPIQ